MTSISYNKAKFKRMFGYLYKSGCHQAGVYGKWVIMFKTKADEGRALYWYCGKCHRRCERINCQKVYFYNAKPTWPGLKK